jgi:hypothetical protein
MGIEQTLQKEIEESKIWVDTADGVYKLDITKDRTRPLGFREDEKPRDQNLRSKNKKKFYIGCAILITVKLKDESRRKFFNMQCMRKAKDHRQTA